MATTSLAQLEETRTDKKVERHFRSTDQAIDFTYLDRVTFNGVAKDAPVVDETIANIVRLGRYQERGAAGLVFDCYNALHRNRVEMTGQGERLTREIMERVVKSDKYSAARHYTIHNDLSSILGAVSLSEDAVRNIPEDVKKKNEQNRRAEEEAQEQQTYAEMMGEDPDADPDKVREAQEAAKDAQARAQATAEALDKSIRDHSQQITRAVSGAMTKATEEASSVQAAGQAFGIGTGDPMGGMTVEEKFALAKQAQKCGHNFRRLMALIGRLTAEAMAKQSTKLHHESGEIVDISTGSDLGRILDEEIVDLFAAEPTRSAALARFADDGMMQHAVETKETLARGDMVILIDESGSMSANVSSKSGEVYTREAQSKAIAIAMVHAAVRQGRKVHVAFFQSTVTLTLTITPQDAKSAGGGVNSAAKKLVQIAQRGTYGGTSFDQPLCWAVDQIRSGKAARSDILMLTDGCCDVHDTTVNKINDLRRQDGASVFSMLIGGEAGRSPGAVREFSNKVWAAESLLDGAASDLFEVAG